MEDQNRTSKLTELAIPLRGGGVYKALAESKDHNATDDVFMIACHITNKNSFDMFMIEDERFIQNPKKYLIKSGETIIIPHTRMIPWNENGLPMNVKVEYGKDKRSK